MDRHPEFAGWDIPALHVLGKTVLRRLGVDDLDRDYEAVMSSAAEIKAANPDLDWPDGLTREDNLIDLAWHQREFTAGRSFAWVVENPEGDYLGCVYVYPAINGDKSADVRWWWKSGADIDRDAFYRAMFDWLESDDWPPLDYRRTAM